MQIDNKKAKLCEFILSKQICLLLIGSISGTMDITRLEKKADIKKGCCFNSTLLGKTIRFWDESGSFTAKQPFFYRLEKMEQRFVFCQEKNKSIENDASRDRCPDQREETKVVCIFKFSGPADQGDNRIETHGCQQIFQCVPIEYANGCPEIQPYTPQLKQNQHNF